MVDYEKGNASWDIGQILTRHKFLPPCSRIQNLRNTAGVERSERLRLALATPCDCGKGDSDAESTSLRTQGGPNGTRSATDANPG